jgi:hypothetical protein
LLFGTIPILLRYVACVDFLVNVADRSGFAAGPNEFITDVTVTDQPTSAACQGASIYDLRASLANIVDVADRLGFAASES